MFPGDVILGDSDGVIVIPAHLADEIADEAVEMTAFEDFVTEQVQKGRSILGLYPATDDADAGRFRGVAEEERAVGVLTSPACGEVGSRAIRGILNTGSALAAAPHP